MTAKQDTIDELHVELGERLRTLRKSRNLTLPDVAEVLGVASNTIGQYECGKRKVNLGILRKFAEFYNVSLDFLIDIDFDEPKPDTSVIAQTALWRSEFDVDAFTDDEVRQLIDYAHYLIYKRGVKS